jgi:hypothetical protein
VATNGIVNSEAFYLSALNSFDDTLGIPIIFLFEGVESISGELVAPSDPVNIDHYSIWYISASEGDWRIADIIKEDGASEYNFVLSGLTSGETYTFLARANRADGQYGLWGEAKEVTAQ